ncbi:hypothetical protein ACXN5S_19575 [Pseudoroseicyclus sp. H15]
MAVFLSEVEVEQIHGLPGEDVGEMGEDVCGLLRQKTRTESWEGAIRPAMFRNRKLLESLTILKVHTER